MKGNTSYEMDGLFPMAKEISLDIKDRIYDLGEHHFMGSYTN